LAEALRCHASYRESRKGGRRAVLIDYDFAGLSLARQDLSHADLTGSSFFGSDLSGCCFDFATAFGCDFREANLTEASLVRTDLRGCHFAGGVLIGANLFAADLREGMQIVRDSKGEFHVRNPDGRETSASTADFSGANLTNARLAGVIAFKTDFTDAIMRGCRLTRAHLRGANFSRCDLEGADFGQADIRDACFRDAILQGTTFDYANSAGANMQDTLSDKPHGRLVSELGVSLEDLLRRHLDFIKCSGTAGDRLDLSGFDLRGAGATLTGACLTMATAADAVFYGLDLTFAAIQASKCPGADFRNCKLDEADMRGICLTGAKLNNASLRNVNLRALRLEKGMQMPADLSNATLCHADLSGAHLSGTRLAGADLSYANLTNAELAGVDLAGVRLVGCKLTDAQRAAAAKPPARAA
jgi:uncharacterized protein YjbI with pentapeptide repeats